MQLRGPVGSARFSDIYEKIIPFFTKYPIAGIKLLDFLDLCKAAEIVKAGEHLSKTGLNKIKKLKLGMNTGRK